MRRTEWGPFYPPLIDHNNSVWYKPIPYIIRTSYYLILKPLNAELNPICHLLELLGTHHILHVFRIRVKLSLFSKSQKNIMKYK